MIVALAVSGVALLSLLLAASAVPVVRRLAQRFGLVDDPTSGDYKTHARLTPYGGGLAIWLATILPLAMAAAWLAVARPTIVHDGVEWVSPWAEYAFFPLERWSPTVLQVSQVGALLLAASAAMLLGLADDRRGMGAGTRFAVQVGLAAALVILIPGFRLPPFGDGLALSSVASVVWIVALTNAFNFIDNMNGLAGGIAAIGLGASAALALGAGHLPLAVLCLAGVGAATGFLIHNFPSASIFMGDAGGLFLGFLAGALSVMLSAELSSLVDDTSTLPVALLPILVFGLPLYDLVTVVFLRLRRGVAPWVGDTRHMSHRLVGLGLDRTGAVLLLNGLHAAIALACAAAVRDLSTATWAVLSALLVLILFASAEIALARRGGG